MKRQADARSVSLQAHRWLIELRPALGGAIGALRYDCHDVLRQAPLDAADATETACFPMIPYANRIAQGAFAFGGWHYRLPPNLGDHPHSLHGVGWQTAWTVDAAAADSITLACRHPGGDGWPWAFHARQRFSLSAAHAAVTLTLTNEADHVVSAGLGLHPYFPMDAATPVTFAADRLWLTDDTTLPARTVPASHVTDWRAGAKVAASPPSDNAFEGWDGAAANAQSWGEVALRAQGADVLHLWRPQDRPFFCLEPASHAPDAINRAGLRQIAPGETLAMTVTIATATRASHAAQRTPDDLSPLPTGRRRPPHPSFPQRSGDAR